MIQNKNYKKNINIMDIFKNFPCTLISLASTLIIHCLIINSLNYKELLPNIIDGLVLYMFILSSIEEILLYVLKDNPNFTDKLRLKIKLIVLITITVFTLLFTILSVFLKNNL